MQYCSSGTTRTSAMHEGIFITGTDTGVGKTEVGTRIAAGLVAADIPVTARKPVESGCERVDGELRPADAARYFAALAGDTLLETICPFRLAAALAPPIAARREGIALTLEELIDVARPDPERFTIVEGAGGFLSPIAEDGLNADLASALGLPVLLVAADRLGCINHVLLTLEAITNRNLNVAGIILSEVDPALSLPDNLSGLRQWQPHPVMPLRYGETLDVSALFSLLGHPLESLHHRIG